MRKLRGNGENMRKWEEMEREWGNGARDRMRERKNFISVFPSLCCKTLKFLTFCHKTLKYVTFCREMLKYGTFCRECRKNLNIRAMRKWFWIKSGCEEAPQAVPAWAACFFSGTHFFSSPTVSSAQWVLSNGFVPKRTNRICHKCNFAFLVYFMSQVQSMQASLNSWIISYRIL